MNEKLTLIGEHRFRFQTQIQTSNPRKIIPLWAEKEFRNLTRVCLINRKKIRD